MKKADVITGFVLLVLAGYVSLEAWRMAPVPTFGPGSGFLPFWLGVLMAILAVILLFKAWRRTPHPNDQAPFPVGKPLITVASLLVGLWVYIILMEVIGFLLNTFLFVAYLLGVVEREKLPRTMLVALLMTVGIYTIFHLLLGITLPRNMLGF